MLYLLVINIIAYLMYGLDKYLARKHMYRISEFFLLGIAIIGGFIGAILGMYHFRHKTKHLKFKLGLPLIAIMYIIIYVL